MTATPAGSPLNFQDLWEAGVPYDRFVAESSTNNGLWTGVYRMAQVPDWAVEEACNVAKRARLLALVEDWCGDASNTIPVLAKLVDLSQCLELRLLRRDQYPHVMDRYLTNGSRSIPIVIALNDDFTELGHWGPRPTELQAWVTDNKGKMPKTELYPETRRWYAKDRGETTLREVLALLPR